MESSSTPTVARSAGWRQWLLFALCISFVGVELLAIADGGPRPSTAPVFHPFTAFATFGILVTYLLARPSGSGVPERTLALSGLAVILSVLYGWAFELESAVVALSMFAALGLVGLTGYVQEFAAAAGKERTLWAQNFGDALIFPLAVAQTPYWLWRTYQLNPVYDIHVYAFEETLGVQWSLVGVRSFELLPALGALATFCYVALPIAVMVLSRQSAWPSSVDVLWASVIAGACGFALYFTCPVVGPLTAFGSPYPQTLPALDSLVVAPLHVSTAAPRNGMPSLHAIWALLIWFNVRGASRPWRIGLRTFVAMNLWAAMALVDTHWITDLVVAIPIAVAIQLALSPYLGWMIRVGAIVVNGAMVAAWLVGLRMGVLVSIPSLMSWSAVLLTAAVPLMMERALWQDVRVPEHEEELTAA